METGAAGGGFPPGQSHLRGDAAPAFVGRDTGRRVGAALDGVERDGDPGLRSRGRGLQVFKFAQLVNQFGALVRSGAAHQFKGSGWPKRFHGINQLVYADARHGRLRTRAARRRTRSDQLCSPVLGHKPSIPGTYDIIRSKIVCPPKFPEFVRGIARRARSSPRLWRA